MANFSQSFTGRGTAVILPESGALKTQEGLSKMVLDAEKLRYEVYQKNRSEFLKNARIDPMFILSKSAKEYVGGLIKNFNDTYGKKAQESNYNLSFQDQMDMQTAHDFIESEKSGVLADQDLIKQQKAVVDKDMGMNLNSDEFIKAYEDYLSGDKKTWDYTLDSFLKPLDFGAYARDMAQKQEFVFDERKVDLGGGSWAMESYNMPDKTQGRFLIGLLGTNPRADKDFWNRWSKADKEHYFQLADANKDNQTSSEEEKNAIALWASEEFADVRMSKQGAPKNPPRAATTGFNPKLPVSATNNKNDLYDMQEALSLPTKYGVAKLPDYMPISTKNPTPIFLTISDYYSFDEQGRTSIEKFDEAQSVSVEVLGYSPGRDMLIIKATSSGTGKTPIFQGNQFAIDAAKYDKYLKSTFGLWREGFKSRRITEGTFVTPRMEQPTQTKSVGGINIEIKQPPKSGLKWK